MKIITALAFSIVAISPLVRAEEPTRQLNQIAVNDSQTKPIYLLLAGDGWNRDSLLINSTFSRIAAASPSDALYATHQYTADTESTPYPITKVPTVYLLSSNKEPIACISGITKAEELQAFFDRTKSLVAAEPTRRTLRVARDQARGKPTEAAAVAKYLDTIDPSVYDIVGTARDFYRLEGAQNFAGRYKYGTSVLSNDIHNVNRQPYSVAFKLPHNADNIEKQGIIDKAASQPIDAARKQRFLGYKYASHMRSLEFASADAVLDAIIALDKNSTMTAAANRQKAINRTPYVGTKTWADDIKTDTNRIMVRPGEIKGDILIGDVTPGKYSLIFNRDIFFKAGSKVVVKVGNNILGTYNVPDLKPNEKVALNTPGLSYRIAPDSQQMAKWQALRLPDDVGNYHNTLRGMGLSIDDLVIPSAGPLRILAEYRLGSPESPGSYSFFARLQAPVQAPAPSAVTSTKSAAEVEREKAKEKESAAALLEELIKNK